MSHQLLFGALRLSASPACIWQRRMTVKARSRP